MFKGKNAPIPLTRYSQQNEITKKYWAMATKKLMKNNNCNKGNVALLPKNYCIK